MSLKFGLSMGQLDVNQAIKEAILAERCGFDGIWMPDHMRGLSSTGRWGELWTLLTAIAVMTRRIRLYSGVTDPVRRHPAQTAQTVLTLDQISNGRVGLGIGAGESMNLLPFGIEWRDRPIRRLREATEVIKMLLQSSPENRVSYCGEFYHMEKTYLQIESVQKPRPPVFIGALGNKCRELAGEISDGWCSWIQSMETLEKGIDDVKRGAKRSGRRLEDIGVALNLPFSISNDIEKSWKAVCNATKRNLIFERNVLVSMGYEEIFRKDLAIQWAMPTEELYRRLEEVEKSVPREAIESVSVFGNVEHAIEEIEKRARLGVNWIVVVNYGPDYDATFRAFKEEIIPYFHD